MCTDFIDINHNQALFMTTKKFYFKSFVNNTAPDFFKVEKTKKKERIVLIKIIFIE